MYSVLTGKSQIFRGISKSQVYLTRNQIIQEFTLWKQRWHVTRFVQSGHSISLQVKDCCKKLEKQLLLSLRIGVSLVAQLVKNRVQCGRPGFDPWEGKIPWRREQLLIPVFWPGEFHGLYSSPGRKESDMTEHFHSLRIQVLLPFC